MWINCLAVDPTFKCHAERSRSIYFKRGLRSFTSCYSLRSSKTSLIITLRNGQDDKFAKKNELRVNIYIIT